MCRLPLKRLEGMQEVRREPSIRDLRREGGAGLEKVSDGRSVRCLKLASECKRKTRWECCGECRRELIGT